jgi:AAA15 family ATPase/GTPase
MLDSLSIKNYRNLKELTINSLGRINLFIGRNNTGKSAILEAIALYATKGDVSFIYQLLAERGEDYRPRNANNNFLEYNIKTLSSMFTDRIVAFEQENSITIGSTANTSFAKDATSKQTVYLRFVKYIDEVQTDNQGRRMARLRTILDDDTDKQIAHYKVGLEINSYILPLDGNRPYRLGWQDIDSKPIIQFIRTRNIDKEDNAILWDNITLTEKENYVINALKIIEPATERLAFIEDNLRKRIPVIKLTNEQHVVPLKSMGDGINRVLTIILALVNSENGFLLIDEFENGLHYNVQEKLWEIIFYLSEQLHIQVFATTHSEDCIVGYESVLNRPSNNLAGKLIRLDNIDGVIRHVEFSADEVQIATEQHIEMR